MTHTHRHTETPIQTCLHTSSTYSRGTRTTIFIILTSSHLILSADSHLIANNQQLTTNIQQATSRQTDGIISQKSADIILYSRLVESRSSSLSVFVFGCCCRGCCRRSSLVLFLCSQSFRKTTSKCSF